MWYSHENFLGVLVVGCYWGEIGVGWAVLTHTQLPTVTPIYPLKAELWPAIEPWRLSRCSADYATMFIRLCYPVQQVWCSDITLSQNVIRLYLACLVSAIQSIGHQGHIWSKLASSYKKKRKGELRIRRCRWTRGQSLRTSQAAVNRNIGEGPVGIILW